jgi:hypothetical protein
MDVSRSTLQAMTAGWRNKVRLLVTIGFAITLLVGISTVVLSNDDRISSHTRSTVGIVIIGVSIALGTIFFGLSSVTSTPSKQEAEARKRLRSAEDQFASALASDIQPEDRSPEPDGQVADSSAPYPEHTQVDGEALKQRAALRERLEETKRQQQALISTLIENAANTPKQEDRLALSALWTVTHSRLDLYHQIATGQARRSFLTAQVATALGFLMLIGFAALAFNVHSTAAAITTGGLGAVSAALAGYIGRTFVRSQESAAEHLRAYFDQPLEFANFLAAERLLASQQDLPAAQRADMLNAIIRAMVASPSLEPVQASYNGHPVAPARKARTR